MWTLDGWDQFLTFLAGTEDILLLVLRISVPLLSLLVIVQCFRSVRRSRRKAAPVVMLQDITTEKKIPVLYWENSIGRSKSCDITVPDETMAVTIHAHAPGSRVGSDRHRLEIRHPGQRRKN